MRFWNIVVLVLVIICCKKEQQAASAGEVLYDSSVQTLMAQYRIDFDKDQQFDFALTWSLMPGQESVSTYKLIALHSLAKIHKAEQQVNICTQVIQAGSFTYSSTYNCNAGETPVSTETIVATPNLSLAEAFSAAFNYSQEDTVLVHYSYNLQDMPSPGAHIKSIQKGFFSYGNSGYLLVEVNGDVYGLKLEKYPSPLRIIEQFKRS